MGLTREGMRMFTRNIRVRLNGWKRYHGSPHAICTHILDDCWNGQYYQTSTGHFNGFYVRDFAWSVPSLLALGQRERVERTLDYALDRYATQRLATTIDHRGHCFDVFTYAPDSLAYLLLSLQHLHNKALLRKHATLLTRELTRFMRTCLINGTIRSDKHFSSIKDHARRPNATYDQWMLQTIEKSAQHLGLTIPWTPQHPRTTRLWTGRFYQESTTSGPFSAEANIIPFWLGHDHNKTRLNHIVSHITTHLLDEPVGLAYNNTSLHTLTPAHLFAPNYEGTTRWMHLGLLYLDVLMQYQHPRAQTILSRIIHHVKRDQNLLELYNARGTPYHTPFYYADEGMIWAAILARHLGHGRMRYSPR